MDPIVQFVVEGMAPQTLDDALLLMMQLPQYASNCKWQTLNEELLVRRVPTHTIKLFGSWLLEPDSTRPSCPNALRLLSFVPTDTKPSANLVLATIVRSFYCQKRPGEGESPALKQMLDERKKLYDSLDTSSRLDPLLAKQVRCESQQSITFLVAWSRKDQATMGALWQWMDSTDSILRIMRLMARDPFGKEFISKLITHFEHPVVSKTQLALMWSMSR